MSKNLKVAKAKIISKKSNSRIKSRGSDWPINSSITTSGGSSFLVLSMYIEINLNEIINIIKKLYKNSILIRG